MPDHSCLPAEITLQIVRYMFQVDDRSNTTTHVSSSRQIDYMEPKPRWSEINGVMCANHSLRQFTLELWFSLLVLRKTSDLTEGMRLFPGLPSWAQ
jgi:4'-phosphopantetheinyl transferase EntD